MKLNRIPQIYIHIVYFFIEFAPCSNYTHFLLRHIPKRLPAIGLNGLA